MVSTGFIIGMVGLIAAQRLFELWLAARNRAWALSEGAREFGAGHYLLFFLVHAGWMVGWVAEAFWRGPALSTVWYIWLILFVAAQGLRYWAITSLGRLWNTRVLVIPGRKLVRSGPFRLMRHPNYVAVAIELASVPLIFGAWLMALLTTLLNAALLLGIRIPAEERALRLME